jgi:hypothetical protein
VQVKAGAQDSVSVTLSVAAVSPLMLTSSTASTCRVSGSSTTQPTVAQITFYVSAPMVQDAVTTSGGSAELLDNGLTISTSMFATLKSSTSSTLQERGTSFLLNGNTLSIAWSPATGIYTQYPNDTITSVTYNNLSSIMLQAMGHPESRASLATMLGMSSITCN